MRTSPPARALLRKAGIKDAAVIHRIVNGFAAQDLMMPRALNEIFENIRDFWVAVDPRKNEVVGCVALHVVGWDNLAEIKSLAVEKRSQRKGVGRLLIEACLREAATLEVGQVFALSYVPGFFKRFGFKTVAKSRLPHKIWAECCHCPKFPDCGEIALLKKI